MSANVRLVSHKLCPYVQRVAIVLAEKKIAYERRNIDLSAKPDWFLHISPLGKTPVLLVNQQPIFESAVICEYLEETAFPPLHPENALLRARHRAWMEFGSALLNDIAGFYNAQSIELLQTQGERIRSKFVQLEEALGEGPYFAGESFCMVDAVFGPVFRYFDLFDEIQAFGFFINLPKLQNWRRALEQRPSVQNAVSPAYISDLRSFLQSRNSELSRRMSTVNT